jgi:peptide-methionine (S)-S-oxide reductase
MQESSSQPPRRPRNGQRPFLRYGLLLALFGGFACASAAEPTILIDPPRLDVPVSAQSGAEKTVFAGGCFWGVQAVFQHTKGVLNAISGYAGGTLPRPSYSEVSSGRTGHAEAVEVTFEPKEISFGRLLQIYFSVAHDPTQLDRQGPDEGSQYRSAIFAASKEQQDVAKAYIAQLDDAHVFPRPIVTKVEPLQAFYPAEPDHQDYATLHPASAYIAINDLPKIENLQKLYPELYRQQPLLVGSSSQ